MKNKKLKQIDGVVFWAIYVTWNGVSEYLTCRHDKGLLLYPKKKDAEEYCKAIRTDEGITNAYTVRVMVMTT